MSNLRQAAQQALEALEWAWGGEPLTGKEMVAIAALRAALAEPEQEPLSLNNGRLTQYPDGSIGVGTPAEPEQPVAVKQMLRWVEHLKRLSDDGQHMSIPGLSSGACWELAIELEQFIKNTAPTPQSKPQTTHWEGCEAVHPECKTEHEVKDLSNYEFKTYKTGGAELEAGFYSTDELRDLVKALDKMNAATERSMKRMK